MKHSVSFHVNDLLHPFVPVSCTVNIKFYKFLFRFFVSCNLPVVLFCCYLLTGRQVMLEQPKKSGGKLVSHILASHGGDKTKICSW